MENRFIDDTACVPLRENSSKQVPIDFAIEDANFRVKNGTFTRGLPTKERIENYVLANDRVTSKWNFASVALIIWKKVEEYLRLFETYGGNRFSLSLMRSLGKLIIFWARMVLRMKLIAKKELNLLFQMTPSRILCN